MSLRELLAYERFVASAKQSTKLRASGAHVPKCFACLRANVPTCVTCSCAQVPTCLASSRAHVQRCFMCSRAHVSTSRALTSNNNNKFLMTCFNQISGTFSLSFSCEMKRHNKSARQARISLETFILRTPQYIPAFLLPGGSL